MALWNRRSGYLAYSLLIGLLAAGCSDERPEGNPKISGLDRSASDGGSDIFLEGSDDSALGLTEPSVVKHQKAAVEVRFENIFGPVGGNGSMASKPGPVDVGKFLTFSRNDKEPFFNFGAGYEKSPASTSDYFGFFTFGSGTNIDFKRPVKELSFELIPQAVASKSVFEILSQGVSVPIKTKQVKGGRELVTAILPHAVRVITIRHISGSSSLMLIDNLRMGLPAVTRFTFEDLVELISGYGKKSIISGPADIGDGAIVQSTSKEHVINFAGGYDNTESFSTDYVGVWTFGDGATFSFTEKIKSASFSIHGQAAVSQGEFEARTPDGKVLARFGAKSPSDVVVAQLTFPEPVDRFKVHFISGSTSFMLIDALFVEYTGPTLCNASSEPNDKLLLDSAADIVKGGLNFVANVKLPAAPHTNNTVSMMHLFKNGARFSTAEYYNALPTIAKTLNSGVPICAIVTSPSDQGVSFNRSAKLAVKEMRQEVPNDGLNGQTRMALSAKDGMSPLLVNGVRVTAIECFNATNGNKASQRTTFGDFRKAIGKVLQICAAPPSEPGTGNGGSVTGGEQASATGDQSTSATAGGGVSTGNQPTSSSGDQSQASTSSNPIASTAGGGSSTGDPNPEPSLPPPGEGGNSTDSNGDNPNVQPSYAIAFATQKRLYLDAIRDLKAVAEICRVEADMAGLKFIAPPNPLIVRGENTGLANLVPDLPIKNLAGDQVAADRQTFLEQGNWQAPVISQSRQLEFMLTGEKQFPFPGEPQSNCNNWTQANGSDVTGRMPFGMIERRGCFQLNSYAEGLPIMCIGLMQ